LDLSDAAKPIILFILIILSGILSAAETALRSVNKYRMRSLADDDVRGAKIASKLVDEPHKVLSALSISIGLLNLTSAALATSLIMQYFLKTWVGVMVGVFILLFLVIVLITPKAIAAIHAEKFALAFAGLVWFLTRMLSPLIFVLNKLSHGIMMLFGIDPKETPASITEIELREILDMSHDEGVIESEERRMITNVVDFGDSLAKDVMVPRIDMAFANVDLTYDELVQVFEEDKYTRLPVYSESRDNVIGIVNLKDVFFYNGKKEDFHIKDIMREAYFTYEFKKTSELLIEMRRDSIPMAIVLDEYGATAGLITIEDLLEEIVGEIRDEYDDDEVDCIQCISENEYIVDGNTKLDDINESLNLDLQSDDYDSIAGHIIYLLDHLPEEGESVTEGNITFTVAAIDKNRIDKVHILINKGEEKSDEDKIENRNDD